MKGIKAGQRMQCAVILKLCIVVCALFGKSATTSTRTLDPVGGVVHYDDTDGGIFDAGPFMAGGGGGGSSSSSATATGRGGRGLGRSHGSGATGEFDGYFADWTSSLSGSAGRPAQPACVDIPSNMSLCHGIGYLKMRLPNLLDHDTLAEALQQSNSWIPLLNIECHRDTQLFLCSLFSPVCLDRPIYPCRSLCDKVKAGCEGRMRAYGFPWPDMLSCQRFPLDNDMCITAQSTASPAAGAGVGTSENQDVNACSACHQVQTYENILDNFCRADFEALIEKPRHDSSSDIMRDNPIWESQRMRTCGVRFCRHNRPVKTKIRKVKKSRLICKRSKVFKTGAGLDKKDVRTLRRPKFILDHVDVDGCCADVGKRARAHYLIMGRKAAGNGDGGTAAAAGQLVPTFIMEWPSAREAAPAFKKAIRRFKSLDCANPKIVSESMVVDGALAVDSPFATRATPTVSTAGAGAGGAGGRGRPARKINRKGKQDKLFSAANSNVTLIGFGTPPPIS